MAGTYTHYSKIRKNYNNLEETQAKIKSFSLKFFRTVSLPLWNGNPKLNCIGFEFGAIVHWIFLYQNETQCVLKNIRLKTC